MFDSHNGLAGKSLDNSNDWDDWRWHMRNSIRTLDELARWIDPTPEEIEGISLSSNRYRWQITPYYASLMERANPHCPVRRQAVPSATEFAPSHGTHDSAGDRQYQKTNRVIHKYPDRVIFLVTELCPVYCRHCTRKFHTTDLNGTYYKDSASSNMEEDFDYIRKTPQIRDVLLTGGDPLTLSDKKLERILRELRSIPHVEIIRIGSRYPVLLPQRITPELCRLLETYSPIWFSTHFNHAKEITETAAKACRAILKTGTPLQNQSVLLKGINDDEQVLRDLFLGLVRVGVRPYYLYQADNIKGIGHFGVSLAKGRELMRLIYGTITGFAVPNYVLETPIGKVPLHENWVEGEGAEAVLKGYRGDEISIEGLSR